LFAIDTKLRREDGQIARTIRCRPLDNSWRSQHPNVEPIGKLAIINYLTFPEEAQISFLD